ncbi:MAG: hypothetical protein JW829_09940, partial [Pirellulales bacterium]|nr:hypothetical protein [Pirellulales bacterium]
RFYDSAGDDLYRSWYDHAAMMGTGYYNYAKGFSQYRGFASSGNDRAVLFDSEYDDYIHALAMSVYMRGGVMYQEANAFDEVQARGINGGINTSVVQAVDYLLSLVGDWD